jgi:hypothetical protein
MMNEENRCYSLIRTLLESLFGHITTHQKAIKTSKTTQEPRYVQWFRYSMVVCALYYVWAGIDAEDIPTFRYHLPEIATRN